jgi:hypothetical protein
MYSYGVGIPLHDTYIFSYGDKKHAISESKISIIFSSGLAAVWSLDASVLNESHISFRLIDDKMVLRDPSTLGTVIVGS